MEELERTFLCSELPKDLMDSRSKAMLDIYIPASSAHPHLRIRKSGDSYEITNKQPVVEGDASRQLEQTIGLSEAEFNDLNQIPGKRVAKTRYYYQHEGCEYEIDVFQEALAGLALVDIEFTSAQDKDSFTPPPFCGPEVTQEPFLAGGMLCGKDYADIEIDLARLEYRKISL